jgi:hypothetical protein
MNGSDHTSSREVLVLRNALLLLCSISLPVVAAAQTTQSGNWSANSTTGGLLHGTWTAVPDSSGATVLGTWTMLNADGSKAAEGGWSAAKAPANWSGAWQAKVTGRIEEYSGTWTSTADLKNGRLDDLFEKAIQTVVSGTWAMGQKSGAWSIRAAPKATPPASRSVDLRAPR